MKSPRTMMAALAGATFAGSLLAGCTSPGATQEQRLALYQAHASAPVKKVPYFNPISWEEIGDEHILVTMKPKEVWLMRLSGPCLDYDGGSPVLAISSQAGYVSSGFDRVTTGGSNFTCRIEEIRQVDTMAMRAARNGQASGT